MKKTKNWISIQPGNDIWYIVGPEYIKGAELPTGLLIFNTTIKEIKFSETIYGEGRRFVADGIGFWISNSDLNDRVFISSRTTFDLYAKATIYGTDPIIVLKSYKNEIKKFLESVYTGSKYITELCINAVNASDRLKDLIEDIDPKENVTISNIRLGDDLYGVPLTRSDINNANYNITVLKLSSINSAGDFVFTGKDLTLTIPKTQINQRTYFTRESAWVPSKNRAYKYLLENAINYFNESQKSLGEFEELENFGNRILVLINNEIVKRSSQTLIIEE